MDDPAESDRRTELLTASEAPGVRFSFYQYVTDVAAYYKHSLWVCQDTYVAPDGSASPAGWTELSEVELPAEATWDFQYFYLDAYGGHTIWLAWRYEGNNATTWWIDDVLFYERMPSLVYEDHILLTDVCDDGGPGNGNGFLEPGENGTLSVTLRNLGTWEATGVAATLGGSQNTGRDGQCDARSALHQRLAHGIQSKCLHRRNRRQGLSAHVRLLPAALRHRRLQLHRHYRNTAPRRWRSLSPALPPSPTAPGLPRTTGISATAPPAPARPPATLTRPAAPLP